MVATKKNIFVAENERSLQKAIKLKLEREGFGVVTDVGVYNYLIKSDTDIKDIVEQVKKEI